MQEALSLVSNSVRNKNNSNITSNNGISRLLEQLPELCKALKSRDQEVRLNQAKGEEMITSLPVFHTVYVKILHPLGCFDFDILLRDLPETLWWTTSVFVSKFSPEVSIWAGVFNQRQENTKWDLHLFPTSPPEAGLTPLKFDRFPWLCAEGPVNFLSLLPKDFLVHKDLPWTQSLESYYTQILYNTKCLYILSDFNYSLFILL